VSKIKHDYVQVPNPITKRWVKIDRSTGSIVSHKRTKGAYAGIKIAEAVKCDCTHRRDEHYLKEGACTKCACTWFHPDAKYCKPISSGLIFRRGRNEYS